MGSSAWSSSSGVLTMSAQHSHNQWHTACPCMARLFSTRAEDSLPESVSGTSKVIKGCGSSTLSRTVNWSGACVERKTGCEFHIEGILGWQMKGWYWLDGSRGVVVLCWTPCVWWKDFVCLPQPQREYNHTSELSCKRNSWAELVPELRVGSLFAQEDSFAVKVSTGPGPCSAFTHNPLTTLLTSDLWHVRYTRTQLLDSRWQSKDCISCRNHNLHNCRLLEKGH